ncbi:MAG: acyl-CoA carboxylase subunit beta [Porphyromonadaceae bacterium]|nr:acyl-CoA carboxylase subunit beta [Porphyromonadaceae bacterium]
MNKRKVFEQRLKDLKEKEELAVQKQHLKLKLTARERLNILFDEGSFFELNTFIEPAKAIKKTQNSFGDGVVVGRGLIQGRSVFAYAQDFTVMGGSLGYAHGMKIAKVQEMALKFGAPCVGLIDSGGARIQEGINSLSAYARIFKNNVRSSGIIPQISVILGPAAGGAVYSPAITDFIIMTNDTSYMFVTGPDVVKEVLNQDITMDDLGGGNVHAEKSGVAHFVFEDEEHAILQVRKLLSYIPLNNFDPLPISYDVEFNQERQDYLNNIVPDDPNRPYDMKEIINILIDSNTFLEVHEKYAQNIIVGFGRLDGKTIGIVANQPKVMAGTLDNNASIKGARFVRFCDSFNIPLLVLEDVPGFMPGEEQEHTGIIRNGAKLLYAFCESTVPRITIITRKAYGGAFVVMNSLGIGGDFNFAWPTAEIAVMGPAGAIKIVNRAELAAAEDKAALEKELIEKYKDEIANPFKAEELGMIDDVIKPSETRQVLITAFDILSNKQYSQPERKHGNIPL